MQRLSQQQKLLQRLSPQQIQLMKLLQVPTAQLEERVKEEIEENPALEYDEHENEDDPFKDLDEKESTTDNVEQLEPETDDYGEINLSDYIKEGDDADADYNFRDDNYGNEDDKLEKPIRLETTFFDYVEGQLGMLDLSEDEFIIARQIIGSLEEDGYLRREAHAIVDDLLFRQNIETKDEVVLQLITLIQSLEPAGIGARNLQECLLLQINRLEEGGIAIVNAKKIITKHFDDFIKKHYPKIQKSLGITDAELKDAIHVITSLNPKPGAGYEGNSNSTNSYIIPDFFIYNNGGKLELTLNSKNAPELRVSSNYRDMLRDYEKTSVKNTRQKDAVFFIKQKLDSAKWFIDAIKQRQHTMFLTMDTILNYQYAFFISGDDTDLKPMILKDIAQRTGLDISTISRVANSKFVQTEYGTYKLKYFFSEAISTDSGEEVSTREVKKILEEQVEAEDKKNPLGDEALAEIMKQKGYNIARRTITKYRELLNIPVARMRKEL
jgi:RNA polymerase sigma-54 factor